MKKVLTLIVAGLLLNTAVAQETATPAEDYTVVLPEAAQKCVLPAAPDAIATDATYDQLVAAKGAVAEFQKGLEVYRTCLQGAEGSTELTEGNKQALVASYNYSVDTEERVAAKFNEAVHAYKEREAAAKAAGTGESQ